jgi:hypothetical protein
MDFKPILSKIGRPRIIEGRTATVSVSLPGELDTKLGQLAEIMGVTRASILRGAVQGVVSQAESEGLFDPPVETPPAATSKPKKKASAR